MTIASKRDKETLQKKITWNTVPNQYKKLQIGKYIIKMANVLL